MPAWLNLVSLHISALLFSYFGILSSMPATRAEDRGEEAWDECKRFRNVAGIFWCVVFINVVVWIWYPVPELSWPVHPNPIVSILIGIAVAIPCAAIVIRAMRDAGGETWQPSDQTVMFAGIYRHIRHPQTLGEMPLWIVIALLVNSLFLVIWMILFISLFTPIMIHYEEKDLVKRFGNEYVEYQSRTGALIPRLRRRKNGD